MAFQKCHLFWIPFFYYVTYWLRSCWNHHFRTTIATIISYLVLQTLFNYLFFFSFTGIDLLVIADDGINKKKNKLKSISSGVYVYWICHHIAILNRKNLSFIHHTHSMRTQAKIFSISKRMTKSHTHIQLNGLRNILHLSCGFRSLIGHPSRCKYFKVNTH